MKSFEIVLVRSSTVVELWPLETVTFNDADATTSPPPFPLRCASATTW